MTVLKQTHGEAFEFKIRSIGNRGAYIGNSYNESPYDVNTEIVRIKTQPMTSPGE